MQSLRLRVLVQPTLHRHARAAVSGSSATGKPPCWPEKPSEPLALAAWSFNINVRSLRFRIVVQPTFRRRARARVALLCCPQSDGRHA
eukprot:289535-Pyramimonas_sp.AAC.1